MRDLPVLKLDLTKPQEFGNVAEKLGEDERRTLATDIIELIGIDEQSMSDWLGKAKGYLDKIDNDENDNPNDREQEGAGEKPPPKTEMTLSAVIQFSARATDALLGEPDLARASEPGSEPLAAWVSSQVRTKDPNWTLDTDPLIIHMSVTGLGWRKRDFDDEDKVFSSSFRPCTNVIINNSVRSVERAPRITDVFERYPYEIKRLIERKKWVDYEPRYDDERDPEAIKRFYDTDLWLDLDGDGIDEPWTVVISRDDTAEVVRIKPRWSAKTVVSTDEVLFFNPIRRFYPYRFLPDPRGGFLPIGFGKLLDRTESSADRLLGSIVDTAKSESENGGVFAGGGFGLPDKIELKNNRIATLNTDGAPLANKFSPFPGKSVSPGSVATLEKLMTLGDRLAGTLNLMENAPSSMTATMAKGIIDTGTQVQSAVHRRMVASMTQEFRMFVQMADAYDMLPENVSASGKDGVAVTADPALATEMQRSAMGGLYLQMIELGLKAPSFSVQEAALRFCKIMRLPDPQKLIAPPPQQPQATPDEKLKGMIGMGKLQIEQMKAKATVAMQLTQALLNMVEASGGMLDNRAALLQMAQIEQTVQELMAGANNANGILDGMASQPGNQSPGNVPQTPPSGAGGGLPAGPGGNAGGPGDSGGMQ
jgi:hypothetical protein